jgi:hypothetical protein
MGETFKSHNAGTDAEPMNFARCAVRASCFCLKVLLNENVLRHSGAHKGELKWLPPN